MTKKNQRHGLTKHPLYNRWKKMIHRCHNPYHHKFPIYGARGVTVSEEWRNDFAKFIEDVGPQPSPAHTLDRIEPHGNYEKANIRWATPAEQARNRRDTVRITLGEESRTLADVTSDLGVSYPLVYSRMKGGWTPEAALYLPPHTHPDHIERDCAKAWEKCFPNGSGDCYLP